MRSTGFSTTFSTTRYGQKKMSMIMKSEATHTLMVGSSPQISATPTIPASSVIVARMQVMLNIKKQNQLIAGP